MVTAAEFLKAAKVVSLRKVEVAGMALHVRGLTGTERRLLIERAKGGDPMQAHELVALATCTPEGDAFFTAEQAAELERVDGQVVEAIAKAILEASGLVEGSQEAAAGN